MSGYNICIPLGTKFNVVENRTRSRPCLSQYMLFKLSAEQICCYYSRSDRDIDLINCTLASQWLRNIEERQPRAEELATYEDTLPRPTSTPTFGL